MCRMCEGASREELLEEARLHIIHHGWFLQGVLPVPGEAGGWVYTVGLLENFGHPELVVTDIDYERGGQFLNMLGELVREGADLRDHVGGPAPGVAAMRSVHPWHFEHDLVNTFIELEGRIPLAGEYLQVVSNSYCDCHRHQLTDLSRSNVVPGRSRQPNRSERRAAARKGKRS